MMRDNDNTAELVARVKAKELMESSPCQFQKGEVVYALLPDGLYHVARFQRPTFTGGYIVSLNREGEQTFLVVDKDNTDKVLLASYFDC